MQLLDLTKNLPIIKFTRLILPMNIQTPNHKEIKKVFSQSENAVVVLFDEY
jgi:hypothetical protein